MPLTGDTKKERRRNVQWMNALAKRCGLAAIADASAKATVEALLAKLESHAELSAENRREVNDLK